MSQRPPIAIDDGWSFSLTAPQLWISELVTSSFKSDSAAIIDIFGTPPSRSGSRQNLLTKVGYSPELWGDFRNGPLASSESHDLLTLGNQPLNFFRVRNVVTMSAEEVIALFKRLEDAVQSKIPMWLVMIAMTPEEVAILERLLTKCEERSLSCDGLWRDRERGTENIM